MRASRLGDDIDDFCVKCKRVMNHAVVSLLNDGPAKVRCRTCHSDHDFRHEQPPLPKVDPRKAALFNQVLGDVTGLPPEPAHPAPAPPAPEPAAEIEEMAEVEETVPLVAGPVLAKAVVAKPAMAKKAAAKTATVKTKGRKKAGA